MSELKGIFKAAASGEIENIKKYLGNSVNINKGDKDGYTPILCAIQEGHLELVEYLIDVGADIRKRAYNSYSAFELACYEGYLDIVKLLINRGYDLLNEDFVSLNYASANGKYEIVEFLLKSGMDINKGDDGGYTPVHWATQEGQLEVVKLLAYNGGDLEKEDENSITPLYLAATDGYTEIIEFFISKNVSIDSIYYGPSSCTPLNIACICNKISAVELLLKNGANIEAEDDEGRTPLFNASLKGNIEVVKTLLKYGANKNTKNKRGKIICEIKRPKIKEEILQLLHV